MTGKKEARSERRETQGREKLMEKRQWNHSRKETLASILFLSSLRLAFRLLFLNLHLQTHRHTMLIRSALPV